MNKVINIQLAGQIFWLDEDAYKILQSYLDKIKEQLSEEEDAAEILKDIELRLAELMFSVKSNLQESISKENIDNFIKQIGFLDIDSNPKNHKSMLGTNSYKIIAGVCYELSTRTKLPVFIMRLLFFATLFAGGFGFVVYVLLYFTMHIHPVVATDKQLEDDRTKILLQKILFFPFYLFGAIFNTNNSFYKSNKDILINIFKGIISIPLLFLVLLSFFGLFQMSNYKFLGIVAQFFFSLSVLSIILTIVWYWINKVLLNNKRTIFSNDLKRYLKISFIYILGTCGYLVYGFSAHASKESTSIHNKKFSHLTINVVRPADFFEEFNINYSIKPSSELDSTIVIETSYDSKGESKEIAKKNIEDIIMSYSLIDSTLTLASHFTLKEKTLFRDQTVNVTIYIPNGLVLNSDFAIYSNWYDKRSFYLYYSEHYGKESYLIKNDFLFKLDNSSGSNLSKNEENELLEHLTSLTIKKFYAERYIWSSEENLNEQEFINNIKSEYVEKYKEIYFIISQIKKESDLKVSKLISIQSKINDLKNDHPDLEIISSYIEALIAAKSLSNYNQLN